LNSHAFPIIIKGYHFIINKLLEEVVLPIIVKVKKQESLNDLIKQFKKQVALSDVVNKVKERQYFIKPAKARAVKKIKMNRLRKRLHSLKLRKNISPEVLEMMRNRLGN